MSDLISRQAALEALKEHRALYCDNTPETFSKLSYAEKSRVDELDAAIATLINLPSAQPELIRCGECKHMMPDGRCDEFADETIRPSASDFCSYAEWARRERMSDLISRKAAIVSYQNVCKGVSCDECQFLIKEGAFIDCRLERFIHELPPAQPEQRWIPCSKRLPPELKPVNVTWINRQPPTYCEKLKDKPFTDTAVIYEGKWYWQSAVCVDFLKEYGESPADDVADAIEIVAWMPLPEPYCGAKMDEWVSECQKSN